VNNFIAHLLQLLASFPWLGKYDQVKSMSFVTGASNAAEDTSINGSFDGGGGGGQYYFDLLLFC